MIPVIFVIFQTGTLANGGVESITQIIENLKTIKPIVITNIETPINQRWLKAGAEVIILPLAYNLGSFFTQDSFKTKIARVKSLLETNYKIYKLLKKNPDLKIVHLNDIPAFRHTGFGAKLAGVKTLLNIRDVKPPGVKYGFQWQQAIKQTDYQLVLSDSMKEAIAARFNLSPQAQERIYQIYSLVDLKKMHPCDLIERENLRKKLNIGQNTFAIAYVATFNEKKAQLKFIHQAGSLLKDALGEGVCYFLGDFEPQKNPYAAECQEARKKLNLDLQLQFIGYSSEIAEWYKAVDLVIIPTRNEGLARCMIESLACSTPVVSFDVCSAAEILEGYNCGVVVEQGNYQKLVEEIIKLAENPSARLMRGNNGYWAAQKLFSCEAIIQQYESLYKNLYN